MAAVTHEVATPSTLNVTSYASGAFTPAAGDLLVAFVRAGATAATGTMTDSQGLGFTKVGHAVFSASANRVYCFVANTLAAASSMTVTFDCTGDAADGAVIFVAAVSGMTRTGLSAVRQSDNTDNGAAAGTPSAVFPAACLTGNPTLGCVGNASNPATLTAPASWTEPAGGDTGYATPTSGAEYVFRNSGFTGTTMTWGSTSATVFGVFAVELDASTVHAAAASGGSTSGGSAAAGRLLAAAASGGSTSAGSAAATISSGGGVAVSIRGGSPLVTATTANPVSGTLTGTRQPQAGDLLVIIHGNDFYAATAMTTPTVGGSTSGVTAITNGAADPGTNSAHIKSYTYVVGSTGDLTVSATESAPGDEEKVLVLYVLAGADTATPIDGGGAGAAGAGSNVNQSTHPAPSVTPTGTDAFLIVHVNSGGGSAVGPYNSPASPFVEQYDANVGGVSYVGGTEQLSTSGATSTRTFSTVGGGNSQWAAVTVAIKTAAGGGGGTTHAATSSGASTSTGSAAVTLQLAAAASGASTAAGSAAAGRLMAAAASGASTSTGSAAVTLTLAALASGASTSAGSADATVVAPGPVTHQAAASGSSTSTGSAAATLRLAALAAGAATSAGSAAISVRLTAAASGVSTSTGTADPGRLLAALAAGTSTSAGSALAVLVGPVTGGTMRPIHRRISTMATAARTAPRADPVHRGRATMTGG